jgi:glycosyltransferase involved in cell wall biosynthesis
VHVIKDALETLRSQSYTNWECIIIDDGSTDNSEEIINKHIKNDSRFKFILRPDSRKKGAATCRNIGLENATGQFIQFLDSDDAMAPNKFEAQINLLKNKPIGTLATCRYGISRPSTIQTKIFKGFKTFKDFKNPIDLLKAFAENFTYFPLHGYLIPTSVAVTAGKWNEDLTVNDDGEYFTRIILNSSQISFCSTTHVIYKTGAGDRISTRVTTENGVESYVQGWNLIDQSIYLKTGIKNHLYVQSAKADLYERLLKENRSLMKTYKYFLDERWQNPNYLFSKFLNRLRSKILVTYTEE